MQPLERLPPVLLSLLVWQQPLLLALLLCEIGGLFQSRFRSGLELILALLLNLEVVIGSMGDVGFLQVLQGGRFGSRTSILRVQAFLLVNIDDGHDF